MEDVILFLIYNDNTHIKKNTRFFFVYYFTSMDSLCLLAICFEKRLKN